MVHDLVEDNGKTIKENNLEKIWAIPIGQLVEITPSKERLYVCGHHRDCDGTPLYSVCMKEDLEKDFSDINNRVYSSCITGYSDNSLLAINEV